MVVAGLEQTTLAGGCFWCVEAALLRLAGVEKVESGYMGGAVVNPTYQEVCQGDTGHAEVVRVTYDPAVLPFGDLLDVFFAVHDPTTLNRQGNDIGTQYRSAIFYHDSRQRQAALDKISALGPAFDDPIVTEVTEAQTFYVAEAYHQDYFARNSGQPYCQYVVAPKVEKVRKYFAGKLKRG